MTYLSLLIIIIVFFFFFLAFPVDLAIIDIIEATLNMSMMMMMVMMMMMMIQVWLFQGSTRRVSTTLPSCSDTRHRLHGVLLF